MDIVRLCSYCWNMDLWSWDLITMLSENLRNRQLFKLCIEQMEDSN
jgi:hypothetical protein